MDHYKQIGEKIRILRVTKGWSQEKLALSADITPSYLGQIERSEKNPTIKILEQISDALDVSLLEMLSIVAAKGDGPQTNSSQNQSLNEFRQVLIEVLRDNIIINCSNQSIHTQGKQEAKGES